MHWKVKAAIQAALAPLPFGERINHTLQVVRGAYSNASLLHELDYMVDVVRKVSTFRQLHGSTILEIGTGRDARHPMLFRLAGAARILTFDLNRQLTVSHCRDAAKFLLDHSRELAIAFEHNDASVRTYLESCASSSSLNHFLDRAGISYSAPADAGATALAATSIDIIYSSAVLEHVTPASLQKIFLESRRILKPGGICYHTVRPGDHFAGMGKGVSQIHFLKYSPKAWRLIAGNRLAYHNRLRHPQYLEMVRRAGGDFLLANGEADSGDVAALSNGFPLHSYFRDLGYTAQELAIWRSEIAFKFNC